MTVYDVSPICDETDKLHTWKYYFHEQFNNPAPPIDPVLVAEADSAIPDRQSDIPHRRQTKYRLQFKL